MFTTIVSYAAGLVTGLYFSHRGILRWGDVKRARDRWRDRSDEPIEVDATAEKV